MYNNIQYNTVVDKIKFRSIAQPLNSSFFVCFFTVVFTVAFRTVLTIRPTPFTKMVKKNSQAFLSIHRYFLARNSSIAISSKLRPCINH